MKIGQRINLLKKIAKGLAEQNYSDGDLILRQFGLPWDNSWGGSDLYNYYLEMIDKAENQTLVELHEYLFPSDELPGIQSNQGKGHWQEGALRLFLSHSSKNKLFVTQIKQQLKEYGIECFIAHEDIKPTKEWLKEIKTALRTCHAVVAFLCEEFSESEYCDQEVGFALQRDILVVPVGMGHFVPYGFMAPFQAVTVDEKKNPTKVAEEIVNIIASHPTTRVLAEKAVQVALQKLVDEFLTSSDFGTSSSLLKKLEQYEKIPSQLIDKLANNWEKNSQIKGCNGIPRRMEKLFQKHGGVEQNISTVPAVTWDD